MKIVLCGGGSGGHITPLLAVAAELRKQHPKATLIYIGERNGKFASIASDSRQFDELHYISAGKLRRYHGESLLKKLLDVKTMFLNFRDLFRFLAGTSQAFFLLAKLQPNAILLKGGFVCVPVALSAQVHNIPYITHDSDALPGLSNRIAARWARYHAVALPAKYYRYPEDSIRVVGVPSDNRFREYSKAERSILRGKYGIPESAPVILVTGGSNGARRMNEAFISQLPKLLKDQPTLHVLHQIGANNEDQTESFIKDHEAAADRVTFFDFSSEIFHMSAISDVVITRAGASIMTDLGNQHKACIVVPNPYLTGGHQLRNAEVFTEAKAALIVREEDMVSNKESNLYNTITSLLGDSRLRRELGDNLAALAPAVPPATALAQLIDEVAK